MTVTGPALVKPTLGQRGPIRPILAKRSNAGQTRVKRTGQMRVKNVSNVSQIPVKDAGQTRAKRGSHAGQTITGQTRIKRSILAKRSTPGRVIWGARAVAGRGRAV